MILPSRRITVKAIHDEVKWITVHSNKNVEHCTICSDRYWKNARKEHALTMRIANDELYKRNADS